MERSLVRLVLLCALYAIAFSVQTFSNYCENYCEHDICDCCQDCFSDKGAVYHSFEVDGFLVKNSTELLEDADVKIEYADGVYLYVFLPDYALYKDDMSEVIYKKGEAKIKANKANGVLYVKDKKGNIVKPTKVIIKNKELCVGQVLLCTIDDIAVKVQGRKIDGIGNMGFVVPQMFIELLDKNEINTFFCKLVNEKLSEAIRFLEDRGIDLKPFVISDFA